MEEQEGFVALDGAAERAAVLIAFERLDGLREETLRVEGVVAQKFPQRTVKGVGTGTSNDVGGGTGAVAEFGVGGVGEDAEFGDGVDGRLHDEAAVDVVKVVSAVDEEVVGFGTLTVNGVGLAVTERASRLRE